MTSSLHRSLRLATLVACLVVIAAVQPASRAATLPERLSDAAFWKLVTDISEPGGYFRITDNFTSNESEVASVSTLLRATHVEGGVYMGVGPEQNFSYIAAIRPVMAFIVDIRRQAVMQHLMFKAAFELSADRAEFISLLFSKPRPAGVDPGAPIQKIWEAFASVATDKDLAVKNKARLVEHLTKTHGFAFTAEESGQLEWVIDAFVTYGPLISTRGATGGQGGNNLTFVDLTGWCVDAAGEVQSFMTTADHFTFVKTLQEKNLVVPVSGDFGGPKAIRAIAAYLREQGGRVSAFYLSNVEQYLFMDGKQRAFYDNVATLPRNDATVFIRPYALRGRPSGPPLCAITGFLTAVAADRVGSNNAALACAR